MLNAMQEQDTDLVDIIREMREARGHLGGFKASRLMEKLQVIGPRIPLDRLQSNIFVRVVDRLGLSWDEYYGKPSHTEKSTGTVTLQDMNETNPWGDGSIRSGS